MSDVKWIKIYTNMMSNKKIKRIRRMPEGNNIVLIWFFLLVQAGECNKEGGLYITDTIPFTIEDLADEFDFSQDVIKLALITLEKYQMIEIFEDVIFIKNWNEYQNADGLQKIKEQTRQRVAKYRKKQKSLSNSNVTVTLPVTECNATEEEIDIEIDIEEENKEVAKKSTSKPQKHKYGEYGHVLLTDIEYRSLVTDYNESLIKDYIKKVDEYIEQYGKKGYKNYNLTIRNWIRKDNKVVEVKPASGAYQEFNFD